MALSVALTSADALLREPGDWRVEATLVNNGTEAVRVPTVLLAAPLVFELVHADGTPVPLGPPPVPPHDLAGSLRCVAPGATLTLGYPGHELLPEAPAPGRYRLRFATTLPEVGADAWSGELVSDWIALEVVPAD